MHFRFNYSLKPKHKGKSFDLYSIATGKNPMEPKIFSAEMSKYIKGRLRIGQEDWDWLRGLLLPSVAFTSRSKLQAYTIKNNAPKEAFNNGYWISLNYAVPTTLKEILELENSFKPSADNPDSLKLRALIVLFYDGSGSHVQMQGNDIDVSTRNLIIVAFRVSIIIDNAGNLVHLEDNQSDETCRPIGLCPGKEDQVLVRAIVDRLDQEAEELQSIDIELNGITITIDIDYHPGIVHSQTMKFHFSFTKYWPVPIQHGANCDQYFVRKE